MPLSRSSYWAILAFILAIAFALRMFGITHGLDLDAPGRSIWNNQNDEETQALIVRVALLLGGEAPKEATPGEFWLWGSGGFYAYRWLDAVAIPLLGWVTGSDVSKAALTTNLSAVLLSHRVIGVIVVLLAIAWLARTMRREFDDRVGLLTAGFFATAYLSVRESHYGTLDPWILLGTTVVLDLAFLLSRESSLRRLLVAGFVAGFFASFKYSGAALLLPLAMGVWFRVRGEPRRVAFIHCAKSVACLVMAACVGYLVMSPMFFRDFATIAHRFASQQGLIGFEVLRVPEMLAFHWKASLWIGFGEIALPCAILGAFHGFRRGARGRLLLLLFIGCAALTFSNTSHSVRQALPCLPALCAFAALGVSAIAESRGLPVVLVAFVAMVPSLERSAWFGAVAGKTDTRVDAMRFLDESGAQRTEVIGVGFYGLPRTSGIAALPPFTDWLDAVHRRRAFPREFAYAARPRLIVRDLSSGLDEWFAWADFELTVAAEYREVFRVSGRRDGFTPTLPDLEHGTPFHFVPFSAPWEMLRPGPDLVIYERVAPR